MKELKTAVGTETLEEKTKLQEEMGFGYRTALGELMYTYVAARPDIGYSVADLSKFSSNLLGVGSHVRCALESHDMVFVYPAGKPDTLGVYVDATHANDLKTKRSVVVYVVTLGGTAVSYRSKLQPTVCTLSTEAECIGAVSAAKIEYVKHLEMLSPRPWVEFYIRGTSPG
eukprot:15366460-Ditylum_brightwellii.AAC.1